MAALEDTSTALSLDEWLCSVLETGGVDGEVYGGYICGSLSTMSGSDREEIVETIQDILSGCLEDEAVCEEMCDRIVTEWERREAEKLAAEKAEEEKAEKEKSKELFIAGVRGGGGGERMKEAKAPLIGVMSVSDKERMVAQYADLSNDEDNSDEMEDDPGGGGASSRSHRQDRQAPKMTDVFENMNTRSVTQTEREKREKEKAAHEAKSERDRKNREAQKQKVLDRKEKEKKRTQKHERRR